MILIKKDLYVKIVICSYCFNYVDIRAKLYVKHGKLSAIFMELCQYLSEFETKYYKKIIKNVLGFGMIKEK